MPLDWAEVKHRYEAGARVPTVAGGKTLEVTGADDVAVHIRNALWRDSLQRVHLEKAAVLLEQGRLSRSAGTFVEEYPGRGRRCARHLRRAHPQGPRVPDVTTALAGPARWTIAERWRLTGMVAVIVALHVVGWSIHLYYSANLQTAGTGTLAYGLGVRHAFDADHIAAIDDTTRLMLQRGGRRPGRRRLLLLAGALDRRAGPVHHRGGGSRGSGRAGGGPLPRGRRHGLADHGDGLPAARRGA